MLTCNKCQSAWTLHPIEDDPMRPLNVYCSENDTVEPARSWVRKTILGRPVERMENIPALPCFVARGFNRVQAIIDGNIPQRPLTLDEIKKYILNRRNKK